MPPHCAIAFGQTRIQVRISETQLRLQLANGQEFTFQNGEQFFIGRLVDCRVRVAEAAWYQCRITYAAGWHITDGTEERSSPLGTWLTSLASLPLTANTTFRIGHTEFSLNI